GALPGRIIQTMRQAGTINPLFMLDEVDKVGTDFRGDPSSALLEVLDLEQNHAFSDHYLEVPYDLSKVLFIATANLLEPILPALRDRLEIIELPGYTEREKLEIARTFLVPKQIKEHGLEDYKLSFSNGALRTVIQYYTREAGVRNLEREIGTICRKVAKQVASNEAAPKAITMQSVQKYLGPKKYFWGTAELEDQVGAATGVAKTEQGGDVLSVEVVLLEGKGNLILTGQLGDVMRESAQAALSYARSRAAALGIDPKLFERTDLHIHVPEGAVPKDGPSAGITLATALISALTHRPVSREVAMTGEITLRGRVLPVGGLKEKVLAAHRAGIKTFIAPRKNKNDMIDLPPDVRREIQFVYVEHMDEVLATALREPVAELQAV
ncbi:MAG TPA: S16 family serine protease, partial [Dehalococcoidia bacterium]|nr:S16 family serine protease [Dehalococcoidia bacterium]